MNTKVNEKKIKEILNDLNILEYTLEEAVEEVCEGLNLPYNYVLAIAENMNVEWD